MRLGTSRSCHEPALLNLTQPHRPMWGARPLLALGVLFKQSERAT